MPPSPRCGRSSSRDPALAGSRQPRLARLLIDAKQADAALKLVGDKPKSLPRSKSAAMRSSRWASTNRPAQAYAQALTKLDVGSPQRRLLELKLTEAGGTPAQDRGQVLMTFNPARPSLQSR